MTVPAPIRRPHAGGRHHRVPAGLAASALGLSLVACGPSPVDMVEHPVTTTPSRMAGEELQRSAEPDDSCATAPAPAELPGTGDRPVESVGPGPARVETPRSPERILALGAGAVDVACALGLQDLVVGTAGLPDDADVYLPPLLADLPRVDLTAEGVAGTARELRPDVIVLGRWQGMAPGLAEGLVEQLSEVAPTIVYDGSAPRWTDATEAVADALGRPEAGVDLLLDVITRARGIAARTDPANTQVSLVVPRGDTGDVIEVQAPDTLGSLMLEAVGAGRPPAQRTRGGKSIPPLPHAPAAGDRLDGDVIFAVVGGGPNSEDVARRMFATDRWKDLEAVDARRLFVMDSAVWEGAGPVAARAVLDDIGSSINGIAADG